MSDTDETTTVPAETPAADQVAAPEPSPEEPAADQPGAPTHGDSGDSHSGDSDSGHSHSGHSDSGDGDRNDDAGATAQGGSPGEAVDEQSSGSTETDLGGASSDGDSDSDNDGVSGDGDSADASGDADGEGGSAASGPAAAKSGRVRALEREGEVAADFLETLLDIADLDGDLDVDVDGDRAAVAIVDSEDGRVPRRLIGTDGKVLEALQELTRLAVQAETGERSRLMLDIGGHRAARRTTLVDLAASAIAEVRSSGESKALEPMSAFERKVVHDEVTHAGLRSESEGVEPRRHIVIHPA